VIAGTVTTILWDNILSRPFGFQGFLMGILLSFIAFMLVNALKMNNEESGHPPA